MEKEGYAREASFGRQDMMLRLSVCRFAPLLRCPTHSPEAGSGFVGVDAAFMKFTQQSADECRIVPVKC